MVAISLKGKDYKTEYENKLEYAKFSIDSCVSIGR